MKMLLIAFNFDSEFGSEPYMAYSRAVAALKKYDLVHVITSDEANLETLKSLEKLNRNRFSYSILLRDRIPKFYGGAKFYVQYRRWQKKIPTHISQLEEKFDIAWHGSLTSPLLGTGLSLSSIPYIYGPLAFSIFPIRYVRIAGINALRELVRNLLVKIILCFDPFVRKSLKNAKVVIPGDENTRQLLVRHSSGNCHFGENVPCYAISNNSKIQVGSKSLDFVWVGKFISRKDPLFALEVARFIVQKRKESKFAFFGGGQLRKKLEILIGPPMNHKS